MTTQRALQYSFTFIHLHTHSYSASIHSTLLFYGGTFRFQHLAQRHFSMQMGQTGDRTAELQVGGRSLYPSDTAAQDKLNSVFLSAIYINLIKFYHKLLLDCEKLLFILSPILCFQRFSYSV